MTEAAKVSVDKVPSLCIPDSEAEVLSQPVIAPTIKQPLVVRESGLPGGVVALQFSCRVFLAAY